MTYTPTCHLLGGDPGLPDDWTLGAAQLAWLEQTLAHATAKWRFTFIHHTVGGNAGDDIDSAYGRGGGRAAHVGEQAISTTCCCGTASRSSFTGTTTCSRTWSSTASTTRCPAARARRGNSRRSRRDTRTYWPDSGYGRVSVSPDHAQVDFVAMGGQVLSSYTLR